MAEDTPAAGSEEWGVLLTAHAVLVEQMERRLAQAGLPSLAWYDALWALERSPGQRLRLSEFEQWMVISRSNITRLVDRLEDAGLARRERSDEDRRGAFAVLTAEGRKMRKRMWTVYEPAIGALFNAPLTAAERAQVGVIGRKLLKAARGDAG